MNERKHPRFFICDPLPSDGRLWPDEFVFDADSGLLWAFTEEGEGHLVRTFTNPSHRARLAREAGEWLARYQEEEDSL